MTVARQRLGRDAEALVAARLERAGWCIVARNARPTGVRGEIDLIALDGSTLVFVEVKARRPGPGPGPESPAIAVGARKRAKLRGLAAAWLRDRGYDVPRHRELRFDVVGLRLDPRGRVVEYEHLVAAF
jgi:putative endonuclease